MIILALVIYFNWSPPVRYKALWDEPAMHFQKVIWPVLVPCLGLQRLPDPDHTLQHPGRC